MKSFNRLCKYSKNSKNASVFPLEIRMNPCHPNQGATQPAKFNLLWQLAVGTLGFDPFGAQTNPSFGCKENPASSMKTITPFTPLLIPPWILLRFFLHPAGISPPLLPTPEYTDELVASVHNPICEANSVPDEA